MMTSDSKSNTDQTLLGKWVKWDQTDTIILVIIIVVIILILIRLFYINKTCQNMHEVDGDGNKIDSGDEPGETSNRYEHGEEPPSRHLLLKLLKEEGKNGDIGKANYSPEYKLRKLKNSQDESD